MKPTICMAHINTLPYQTQTKTHFASSISVLARRPFMRNIFRSHGMVEFAVRKGFHRIYTTFLSHICDDGLISILKRNFVLVRLQYFLNHLNTFRSSNVAY